MAYYEGIGTMSEKILLVFDIGAAYTKFGFAGETSPRCIIPSEVLLDGTNTKRNIFDYKDTNDLFNLLAEFLHNIYMKYALINPKDRSVIIVESVLCPTIIRETLAQVFFHHFEVPSVIWLPSHLVCLATLPIETALVLDIGYKEAVLFPVCEGVLLLNKWKALPIAGKAIESEIKSKILNLERDNPEQEITKRIIEDIKVRTCFVTKLSRAQQYYNNKLPKHCPNVEYPLNGALIINIPGEIREFSHEVLFEKDIDYQSVTTMILDALLQCPKDFQIKLAENLLLIGGTTMTLGFKSRLKEELYNCLETDRYKNKLHIKTFKFHCPPCKENYTAWLGGSIYGCSDVLSMKAVTRDNYFNEKRVPDWCNLIDNQIKVRSV